jgi:hypothetical protein
MDWVALSAIAELLGAGAVVVSLLYLARQIRQNTRQIRLAAQQATVHELGNALRAQAQNRESAELLSRGLNSLDALDSVEKTQFLSHVGHIFRLYESAYLHKLEGTLDPRFWGGFERAIADIMAYPGMQSALRLRRHHLSPEFATFLDQLQSLTPLKVFGELVPTDAITSELVR